MYQEESSSVFQPNKSIARSPIKGRSGSFNSPKRSPINSFENPENSRRKMAKNIDKLDQILEKLTKLDEMEENLKEIKKNFHEISNLTMKIPQIEGNVKELKSKVEWMEKELKAKNIIINGAVEQDRESRDQTEAKVYSIFGEMKLENIEIESAFRLGKKTQNNTRPILVKLLRLRDKHLVFAHKRIMMDHGIFIGEDLSKAERFTNSILRKKGAEIKKEDKSLKIQYMKNRLIARKGDLIVEEYEIQEGNLIKINLQ